MDVQYTSDRDEKQLLIRKICLILLACVGTVFLLEMLFVVYLLIWPVQAKTDELILELGDELTEDAKITIDIYSFKPWSGAVEAYEIIEREGKLDDLDAFIEEMYPDGIRDVDLNDLLRFEPEYVFEAIGLDTSLLD